MREEPTKEARPPEVTEPADADVPQDPGIPGSKAVEEQGSRWAPSTPARGFPESVEDDAEGS
jgi:hypothetical protein